MYEAIKEFNKQFQYQPEIINKEKLETKESFVVVGMGGSALAPLILKKTNPEIDIKIQHDYDLPLISEKKLKEKLFILSSYSGNTEEVLSALEKIIQKKLAVIIISTSGKLLFLAKEHNLPYIQIPDTKIQPRSALGFSIKAFLKILGAEETLKEITELNTSLNPVDFENEGKELAQKIKNHIPIIYASNDNFSLAYNWKIKINETGKIPAFFNVLPELNHNEMTSFDVKENTKELSEKFYFIILKDEEDNPKISKRMEILEKLYLERGLKVLTLELKGPNIWYKIFSSLLLADWFSYYTALSYDSDPEQVPMVEEFKKIINK